MESLVDSVKEKPWHAVLAILLIAAAGYMAFFWSSEPTVRSNTNRLALGEKSEIDELRVPIFQPRDFTGRSVDEVLSMRTVLVRQYRGLIVGRYTPWDQVFRRLGADLPWMSVPGFFLLGPSPMSVTGPSAESRWIMNPYLLLQPEFWGLSIWGGGKLQWDRARIGEVELADPAFPFYPRPSGLVWRPKQRRAEVRYNISNYLTEVNKWSSTKLTVADINFGIGAYNARDFGLRWLNLLPDQSNNIENLKQGAEPEFIVDYLKASGAFCGVDGGCNHRTSYMPAFDSLVVKALPASAVFGLWHSQRASPEIKPALTFTINIE